MKRLLVRRPGLRSKLELVDGPEPPVGVGDVRVTVRAVGVNYADWIVRLGLYEAAKGLYPMSPGFEFAGAVETVGPGVDGFVRGQPVFGITLFEAYATSVTVKAAQLWPCPDRWSFEECAALPAVHLTAHYGLTEAARVRPGEWLLVHSAAGGVGCALLQIARVLACPAVAVVGSPAKEALCRELGAEAVIVRPRHDLWKEAALLKPGGYDAVFDAAGVATLRPGLARLRPGGRLVVYGFSEIFPRGRTPNWLGLALGRLRVPSFSPLELTGANKAVVGFNVVHLFDHVDLMRSAMADILGWISSGRLRKPPVTAVPFERAEEAHQLLCSGTTTGKLVLTLD